MIVLHPGQIEVLQRGLEPHAPPKWIRMSYDAGVHAMRCHLTGKEPWVEFDICAAKPQSYTVDDDPGIAPVVRSHVEHGNMHYGVGGLVVAVGSTEATMEIWGSNGDRITPTAFAADLMRPFQVEQGTWVPFDFGAFTDLRPLRIRFDFGNGHLSGAEANFDFFLITRIAPPHVCRNVGLR